MIGSPWHYPAKGVDLRGHRLIMFDVDDVINGSPWHYPARGVDLRGHCLRC